MDHSSELIYNRKELLRKKQMFRAFPIKKSARFQLIFLLIDKNPPVKKIF